ncbi:MAG TPA: DUF433 domain-containing protein [Pyrinomonadaceae bacterium]|jgi:uncharacterized protein (DUF433 family)|nr:DUF433 domain-containing protein [Pyrinomonadaceae bacterium]
MSREYVEQRDGTYRIVGTRVSLDSVVYAFLRGASPESIQRSFPSLTLEQIYGAITYYLAHQEEINQYLLDGEAEFEKLQRAARDAHPDWDEKLDRARREALTSHS